MANIEMYEDKVRKIIIIYKENDDTAPKYEGDGNSQISKKAFHDIGIGLISGGFAGAIGVGVTGGLAGGQFAVVIGSIVTLVICTVVGIKLILLGSKS